MEHLKKRSMKLLLALLALAIGIGIIVTVLYSDFHVKKPISINGTILTSPKMIQPFELTDTQDKSFTNENLKGHWSLIFFGFTHCPDVCPTTLSELTKAYVKLKKALPSHLVPKVIMVTVDPERDSTDDLKNYLKKFNSTFIGLKGNVNTTKSFASMMSIAFGKTSLTNGKITLTHSARIILLDPDGNIRAFFAYPHRSDTLVRDYKKVVLTTS